ncbi:MAG: PorT family protein [Prevotellaceae bacterium]|nr:PorT family protein [Prevotellaceae bacterium]
MNLKNKLRAITIASLFVVLPFLGKAQHFIGIKEGVNISSVWFNPAQKSDSSIVQWLNVGLVYKYYNLPWVGFQTGLNLSEKGFMWNDTIRRHKVLELPLLSQFHYETWHLRFIINAGMYASYALSGEISYEKNGAMIKEEYVFTTHDRRIEYGMHAGGGIGFIFKPFELQFEAGYQFAFSYVMDPHRTNKSTIYTRFQQWMFSVALLFQL